MDDEELLRIADEQLNFLDRMSVLHQRRMQAAIEALEKRIVDKLTILKTSDSGNLLGVKTNLAQAQKVHSDLTTLFDEEYGAASRTTVKEYSESLPIIQEQYKAMEEAVKYTGVDKEMVKALKTQDLAAYSQFGRATQDKIATALYDHVVAQSPFSTLAAAIAGALTGHKDARGKPLSNYAKQMANDGIMNFHNAVNLKKAEDAGFTHFLYVGNIIADSRDFCVKRAGNVYTKEQINSWTGHWQGKSGPAMTHRGGYNCRHHWQPVRKEWIPEGGIEVQSFFDRAGVMPVSKLSKSVTGNPKFKAYQAWQKSLLIDKKPLTASELAEIAGTKKAAATGWLSQWGRGYNLPQGWQSVVRDLEAQVGRFERAPQFEMPKAPIPKRGPLKFDPNFPTEWDAARKKLVEASELVLKERGYSGDLDEFYLEAFGKTKDEVEKTLTEAVDKSSVWMSIKGSTLKNKIILPRESFKNSLETGKGTFKIVAEDRTPKERAMFGITADLDDYNKWPKYGFLSSSEAMNNPKMVGFGYGNTFVKFKSAVKQKAMFTVGDSYNGNMARSDGVWTRTSPSVPVAQPSADALLSMGRFQRGYLGKGILHGAETIDDFAQVVEYAEAQIYGELDITEVEVIYSSSKKEIKGLQAALKKVKLDIEVRPLQYDERLKDIWGENYSDAACKWRDSLSSKDIDTLPDPWISKLGKTKQLAAWFKNSEGDWWKKVETVLPEDLKKIVLNEAKKLPVSADEHRRVARWFYSEIAKREKSVFDKVIWKDHVPSKVGWLDDVAAEDLITDPKDERFVYSM